MSDHLTMQGVKWFQTATSLNTTNEEKKAAIEQLLKNAIPKPAREELLIILNEICPLEAIEYREVAA
ncbi:hypothetical protein [Brucella pituitosa]